MGQEETLEITEELESQEAENIEEQSLHQDDNDSEGEAESEEVEVIREGAEKEQKKDETPDWMKKQLGKLRAEKREAKESEQAISERLAQIEEENKVLKIALNSHGKDKELDAPPNPQDFDAGQYDPEYQKRLTEYNQRLIASEVDRRLAEANKLTSQNNHVQQMSKVLEQKQVEHYEKAKKMGVKDYPDTEDKAIETLGKELSNQIIANTENSHALLYYLGKNPSEAEAIKSEIEKDPVKGVLRIGSLQAELRIRPKSKTIPEPDEPLEGATSARGEGFLKGAKFE